MLETIKFSNEKTITFICPVCHKIWEDERISDDPDDTHYAMMTCGDCHGDYDDNITYYDKYGYVLKMDVE